MSTLLSETLGVAESGAWWPAGNFLLFQSTRPDVILFMTKQLQLVKGSSNRYQIAISSYSQQQADHSYRITGGSAAFTVSSSAMFDSKAQEEVFNSWRSTLHGQIPDNVKFVPLNVQKGVAEVLINPMSGTPDKAHNDKDVGTPGGTISFLIDLTELGAQEWVQGVKNKTAIPAAIKFNYEYLRMMPPVGAQVKVWGKRVFDHLSAALDVSYDGLFYGGSAKLEAEWEKMQRNGDVEVTFLGGGLPPDLEKIRQDITTTFANQARELLFSQIFAPKPDVKPAEAGHSGGIFGGANFAMKWKHEEDTIDLTQTINFKGMTWLRSSMDTDLSQLFANLDPSYVTEVQTQQAFDSSIVIDSDEMLSDVAVSMSYSEGHSPEAPVFNKDGGNQRYVVVSQHPDDVKVSYTAKINYASPRWPIVTVSESKTVKDGGNQMVVKPGQWVGRHEIYMFVRDGNQIVPPSQMTEDDYLVVNVAYNGPHLKSPIKDSAHLSGLEMIQFSYPLDPAGGKGEAKFSAFGVIGGKLVRAKDQVIAPDETAVFILASKTDGTIQLVSKDTVLPESDTLAQSLLEGGARPVVSDDGTPVSETEKHPAGTGMGTGNGGYGKPLSGLKELSGVAVAVDWTPHGPGMWIQSDTGDRTHVRLHESYPFENTRRRVRVQLDDTGTYADSIMVELDT